MTYRIRKIASGLFFAGVDKGQEFSQWVSERSLMAPVEYPTVDTAADAVAQYDLDGVEIVEVLP